MIKVLIFLIFAVSAGQADPNYCFSTDPLRLRFHLSKYSVFGAYDVVRGTFNPATSTCTPSKFWLYTRHPSRLPFNAEIVRMRNIEPQVENIKAAGRAGQGTLCQQDFDLIDAWNFDPNITTEYETLLTVSGWNEMKGIAQRFQQAFPTLLPTTYNRAHFVFKRTAPDRSEATVKAFSDGLFGDYEQIFIEPTPDPDMLLRPHEADCPLFDEASVRSVVEQTAFINGPHFQNMLNRVNDKLGLSGNQRLTERQVRTLWEICYYEQAWNMSVPAPFCGAFSVDDLLILEYFEDLHFYIDWGHGGPQLLFENLNCGVIQELLDFMDNDDGDDRVRLYVSHADHFQFLLVALRVFGNDVPLTAANYNQQANREWKSSVISPMATNIAAIRYE